MARNIKMTFECNQNWDGMKVSGQGRYCESCRKHVFDFSDKPFIEIDKIPNGELCGMFRIEQVEPDLRLIEIPFSVRTSLLTIGTILGLELNQVNGQVLDNGHKIEKVDLTKADTVVTHNTKLNSVKTAKIDDGECVSRPVRKRYYFSKKFPFIVKRRIRTVGRYRL
jgi:hypothetical protein